VTELKPTGIYVTKLIYNNYLIITYFEGNIKGYYMAIFISYPISTRDTHITQLVQSARANIGFVGWYGVWYEDWQIITYLSYTSNSIKRN